MQKMPAHKTRGFIIVYAEHPEA